MFTLAEQMKKVDEELAQLETAQQDTSEITETTEELAPLGAIIEPRYETEIKEIKNKKKVILDLAQESRFVFDNLIGRSTEVTVYNTAHQSTAPSLIAA